MSGQAEMSSKPESNGAELPSASQYPSDDKTILTILVVENRPLMGEIFAHALKKAAGEWNVRLVQNLDEGRPEGSLAVFNFMQRDSDSYFIAFILQQLRTKLGDTPLFVIIDSADPAAIKTVDEAGLQGWISTSMGFDAIVSAIRRAMTTSPSSEEETPDGGHEQPLQMAPAHPNRASPRRNMHSEIYVNLTEREIDVLSLLRKGKQNKVIAHALNISESTAKVHIRNIMRKFHLRNRTEVALMCGSVVRQQGDGASTGSDS
jgi:DNA-binding NarL/FixJ family response regulator